MLAAVIPAVIGDGLKPLTTSQTPSESSQAATGIAASTPKGGIWPVPRDIAARTGVTERTAYGIVTDLTQTGYVAKHEDRRRNRSQIQAHLPLPGTDSRERAIGEILALLAGSGQAARAADLLREHLASIGCDPSAIRITARLQPPTGPGDDFEDLASQLPGCHATPWSSAP